MESIGRDLDIAYWKAGMMVGCVDCSECYMGMTPHMPMHAKEIVI